MEFGVTDGLIAAVVYVWEVWISCDRIYILAKTNICLLAISSMPLFVMIMLISNVKQCHAAKVMFRHSN